MPGHQVKRQDVLPDFSQQELLRAKEYARAKASSATTEAPSNLFVYFRGGGRKSDDMTAQLVNLCADFLQPLFPSKGAGKDAGNARQQLIETTALYKGVLQHMLNRSFPLQVGNDRFRKQSLSQPECVAEMLAIPDLHYSVLACTSLITCHVLQSTTADELEQSTSDIFLSPISRLNYLSSAVSLWQAAHWLTEYLGADAPPLLRWVPSRLARLCEERLAMAAGSTLYVLMMEGGGAGFPGGEMSLVASFISSYAQRAVQYTYSIAQCLQGAPYGLTAPPQFPALCAMVMDQALTDHLDLAFNNHMCVLVASSVYGVSRGLKLQGLHFKTILECITAQLPDHEHDPWDTHVQIKPATLEPAQGAASAPVIGDVRAFYSQCFIRRLEGFIRAEVCKRPAAAVAAAAADTASQPIPQPRPPSPDAAAAATLQPVAQPSVQDASQHVYIQAGKLPAATANADHADQHAAAIPVAPDEVIQLEVAVHEHADAYAFPGADGVDSDGENGADNTAGPAQGIHPVDYKQGGGGGGAGSGAEARIMDGMHALSMHMDPAALAAAAAARGGTRAGSRLKEVGSNLQTLPHKKSLFMPGIKASKDAPDAGCPSGHSPAGQHRATGGTAQPAGTAPVHARDGVGIGAENASPRMDADGTGLHGPMGHTGSVGVGKGKALHAAGGKGVGLKPRTGNANANALRHLR